MQDADIHNCCSATRIYAWPRATTIFRRRIFQKRLPSWMVYSGTLSNCRRPEQIQVIAERDQLAAQFAISASTLRTKPAAKLNLLSTLATDRKGEVYSN